MIPDGHDCRAPLGSQVLPCSRVKWRAISGTRDFSRVYEEGVKTVGRLLVLYLFPGDDFARAVVASRRVGGAVARNRAKRLLRVAIRDVIETPCGAAAQIKSRVWPDAPLGDGLWVVTVARARILGAIAPDVTAELEHLLDRFNEQ